MTAPIRQCASCGLLVTGSRCGRCTGAQPDPRFHEAAYSAWGTDCARQLRRHLADRGIRSTDDIAAALLWLLDDGPLPSGIAEAVSDYPRCYLPKRRWRAAVAAAMDPAAPLAPRVRTLRPVAQADLLGWKR